MARENHKKGIGVNFGFEGEGYLKLVNVLCDFIGS